MIKVEIESKVPDKFFQIFASIGFWNQEGQKVYDANKKGLLGSKVTQEAARKETFENYILNCLSIDISTVLRDTEYKCGKGGSHLWVSNNDDKRMLFIHF